MLKCDSMVATSIGRQLNWNLEDIHKLREHLDIGTLIVGAVANTSSSSSVVMDRNSTRKPKSFCSQPLLKFFRDTSLRISDGPPLITILLPSAPIVHVKFFQSTVVVPRVRNHCMPRIRSTLPSSKGRKSSLIVSPAKDNTTFLQIPLPRTTEPVPIITP